jgi:hypothetical protein
MMSAKSRAKAKPRPTRRCARCATRLIGDGVEWSVSITGTDGRGFGGVSEVFCDACTTPAEYFERVIRDSTTNYRWHGDRLELVPKTTPKTLN